MSSRNATASWSGYSHQGQVGLLVALKEMRRLMQADLQNEFDSHFVEYENREDVAISKQLQNTPKELISVHQVKAYYSQGHLINTYKSVFIKNEQYKRDEDGEYILDQDGEKIELDDYVDDQWGGINNYLHTSTEITNWADVYFQGIGGNPFNVERYPYSSIKSYCGTDEIADLIIKELNSSDFHNGNNGASTITLNHLTFKLDEKIRHEHATKDGKAEYDIKFSFQELHSIINDDFDVLTNNIFQSRKLFYEEFVKNVIAHQDDDDNEQIEILRQTIIKKLYELSDSNFLNFLRKLNLNVNLKYSHLPQYNFNPEGIKNVFMKILLEIKNTSPEVIENSVQYTKGDEKLKYVLTTITSEEDDVKLVISEILENLQSQNILWENHALINRYITSNFSDNIPKITNINIKSKDGNEEDKFMSFTSKSKLIKRDEALIILKDDTTA
ncbi:ABC-three component system protein [Flavobacterium adhaerens]|uniref:ABC-three component system protein n=1 Tax=Flavobacterium adhaerens TaxID=3149043 RepID=UPI0032B3B724